MEQSAGATPGDGAGAEVQALERRAQKFRGFDHVVLLKPRVMALVVFTGAVGYLLAPGPVDWMNFFAAISAMAAAAGRLRGAQHVVGRRHRRQYGAARRRARFRAARWRRARRLFLGLALSVVSVAAMAARGQYAVRRAAGADHRHLHSVLHHGDQAAHAHEHRLGRRGRRPAPRDRLGGGQRPVRAAAGVAVPGDFSVDAAAFLGAGAAPQPRLRAGSRAHAAHCRRTRRNLPADRALQRGAGGASLLPLVIAKLGLFYAVAAAALGAVFVAKALRLYGLRHGPEIARNRAAMALFGFSILYLFALFAIMLVEALAF